MIKPVRSGNPYARIADEDDGSVGSRPAEPTQHALPLTQPSARDAASAAISPSSRGQGNPYAALGMLGDEDEASCGLFRPVVARRSVESPVASKSAFVAVCTRIFKQYIPPFEKGGLRPHHRAFIERNERRSPSMRAKILEELKKYDLSPVKGLSPLFNRERDVFTESKLEDIERSAEASKNDKTS